MAAPTSGEISFNNLHAQVSSSPATECSMNDADIGPMFRYWVVNTQNSITTFYGCSSKPGGTGFDITAPTYTATATTGTYAQLGLSWQNNGNTEVRRWNGASNAYTYYTWHLLSTSTVAADYEISWVMVSGPTLSSSWAQSTYTPLSTSQWVGATDSDPGSSVSSSVIDVTIRSINSTWNAITQRYTIVADYEVSPTVAWTTTARSSSSFGLGGSSAEEVGHRMYSNGTSQITNTSGTYLSSDAWCSDTSYAGTGFEMYWNKISGFTPNEIYGTEDTWLPLDGQTFRDMVFYSQSTTRQCVFDVTVREDNNASTEVTKRITLSQEWEP